MKVDKTLEYHRLGTFTLQDFVKLADNNQQHFEKIDIYTQEEFGDQKSFTVTLQEFKTNAISAIKEFVNYIATMKMRELLIIFLASVLFEKKAQSLVRYYLIV